MKGRAIDAFERRFGESPAWVIRSPGRINLIGEHTDYNDGHVLPMAIDRAVWLALRPRDDARVLVESLGQGAPAEFDLHRFARGGQGWVEYLKGMARMLQDAGHPLGGWEGVLASDVPIGSGLSSSAALEMATGMAFAVVSDLDFDGLEMARVGQRAENEWVGAQTGIMDQAICANGRAGSALWIDCRSLAMQPVPLPRGSVVLVMDTMTRHSHTRSGYNDRRESCEKAAGFFDVSHLRDLDPTTFARREVELDDVTRRRARHVLTENARVLAAVEAMRANDPEALGLLMDASHQSLRDDFEVTNTELDTMVRIARAQPGCFGARMTGGGFGGCAIALVDAAAVDGILGSVAGAYESETGRTPEIFDTHASAGTSVESPSRRGKHRSQDARRLG